MRRLTLATLALLALTGIARAEDKDDTPILVEISGTLVQIRPDSSGASARPLPTLTCVNGTEAKIFVGRQNEDGHPDPDAIRFEVTPNILPDGRIQIRFVSLGVELGEQPDRATEKTAPKTGLASKITFHSALPADGLYSVTGQNGYRSWMRLGQKVDGWSLSSYDKSTQTLVLNRAGQILRLSLTKASLGEAPNANRPRIEVVTVLPGEAAEFVGKDGRRVVLKAQLFSSPPPGR